MRDMTHGGRWLLVVAFCSSALLAESAVAETVLSPGETQYLSEGANVYTVGGVPSDFTFVEGSTLDWTLTGAFTGKLVSKLYQNSDGEYAFSYQLSNTSTNGKFMTAATIGDDSNPWKGITITQVGANSGGVSTGDWSNGNPLAFSRDKTSRGEGLRISFYNALEDVGITLNGPTNLSAVIWVATTAKSFTETDVAILDSGAYGYAKAYAPIPEPSTLVMLSIAGVLGIATAWNRRRFQPCAGERSRAVSFP